MKRRQVLAGGAAAAALTATGLPRPAIAQVGSKNVLRFVPQANLANPDPIWTTATVAINHGYMVYDTLYGVDDSLTPRPQMCAGHELSPDELTWTFTLRDGLLWQDGAPVRGADCTQSIQRWWTKNPFGQQLESLTDEIKPLDDKRFQIRLKKRFPQILYAFGAEQCFIMPEHVARTPASEQIKEFVGSGPFRFLPGEWVSGARAVYARNDRYLPRDEPPQFLSGGKVVHFDRVEWIIQPDPATQAASLQTGEVDWLEFPLIDLLPTLREAPGCTVVNYDPRGTLAIIAFNHLFPPFDNPKLLRALLPAVDQREYITAWVGEQKEFGRYPDGFFTAGTPMASSAGMEALTGPRDIDKARQLVRESGYKGEKIVLMAPSDQASLVPMCQVTRALFQKLGINVDYQVMDWGTLVSRRAKMDPPDKGGWNVFCTTGAASPRPIPAVPTRCARTAGRAGSAGRPTRGWRNCASSGSRRRTSRRRKRSASRSSSAPSR